MTMFSKLALFSVFATADLSDVTMEKVIRQNDENGYLRHACSETIDSFGVNTNDFESHCYNLCKNDPDCGWANAVYNPSTIYFIPENPGQTCIHARHDQPADTLPEAGWKNMNLRHCNWRWLSKRLPGARTGEHPTLGEYGVPIKITKDTDISQLPFYDNMNPHGTPFYDYGLDDSCRVEVGGVYKPVCVKKRTHSFTCNLCKGSEVGVDLGITTKAWQKVEEEE